MQLSLPHACAFGFLLRCFSSSALWYCISQLNSPYSSDTYPCTAFDDFPAISCPPRTRLNHLRHSVHRHHSAHFRRAFCSRLERTCSALIAPPRCDSIQTVQHLAIPRFRTPFTLSSVRWTRRTARPRVAGCRSRICENPMKPRACKRNMADASCFRNPLPTFFIRFFPVAGHQTATQNSTAAPLSQTTMYVSTSPLSFAL